MPSKKKAPLKPLTDKEWLNTNPPESEVEQNAIGRLHIPIEKLRPLFDRLNVSARNYHVVTYKEGYGEYFAFGSIELTATIDGRDRTVIGAYNLNISEPINGFWNGTLKSECVKNAAAELGTRFGRGLNKDMPVIDIPLTADNVAKVQNGKPKPDSKIMQQYLKAVERGDQAAITTLTNIYEIKTN